MLGSGQRMAATLAAGSDQRSLLTFPAVRREDLIARHAQVCEESDSNSFSVVETEREEYTRAGFLSHFP